uniref:Uncharacterized protein n=1 Tax=viral metagenome TaxID=1070528 RepID=A0A6C0H9I7_9ZZZZ
MEPYKITDIDLNYIYYSNIKQNQDKKIILIKYNDNNKLQNFVFQIPILDMVNNITIYDNYGEIDLSLNKDTPDIHKFIHFLNELENKIKNDAKTNLSSWFTLDNNNTTINYQKIIRGDSILKIKLIKNNDFETIIQMNNNIKIDLNNFSDNIPDNCPCKIILECYALWIHSSNVFGIFFRPVIISFYINNLYDYKFIEDSDIENIDIPDTDINGTNNKNNIFLTYPNNEKLQSEYNVLYNSLLNTEQRTNKIPNKRGPNKRSQKTKNTKKTSNTSNSEEITSSILQNSLLSKTLLLSNDNNSANNNIKSSDNNLSTNQLLLHDNIDNISSSSSIRDNSNEEM